MKYWYNGFYLEQNADKTRYEITDEYLQELLEQQSLGKEITTGENGKPIAVDHISTPKELAQTELFELTNWFTNVYAPKEQKLRRLNTLQMYTDDHKMPYNELLILYNEAETKRKRIQDLEAIIG